MNLTILFIYYKLYVIGTCIYFALDAYVLNRFNPTVYNDFQ